MPPFGPISRAELVRGDVTLRVPNPHRGDVGRDLLARVLKQGGISREEWDKA